MFFDNVWFILCTLLISIPTLVVVGAVIVFGWVQSLTRTPRAVTPSLVAFTVALLPDLVMLVNLFKPLPLIHGLPSSDNVPLFEKWQIVSGSLLALTVFLSFFERTGGKKLTLQGSLVLVSIHGAGSILFFIDSLLAWFRT